MNYRHSYHAGNFADVLKHVVVIELLLSLCKKPTPLCYLDTHAGAGFYDLFSAAASKNKEYVNGIEKIMQAAHAPLIIKSYLECVRNIHHRLLGATFSSLRYYPGSPLIAQHFTRCNDRLIACELHPQEYQLLKNTIAHDHSTEKSIAIHHMDGYLGLKAFLPPRERRGLILIDPPYEHPNEFTHIMRAVVTALKRWETGVYAIWYPLKDKREVERFYRSMRQTIPSKHLIFVIELSIYPDVAMQLNGCGMMIVNPPFQFEQAVQSFLPWLWTTLSVQKQGQFRAYFLK